MPLAGTDVRGLFLAALERPPAERLAYLDEACGGDADLRQRVEALLRAHDEPGAFLGEGKPDPNATVSQSPASALVGAVIAGRYKLLEEIGDGGMGTVWMAEQKEPVKRLVAVKLIKAGMDSKSVLARFEAERQALALMDHPNIAKVFDGGTTADGHPFFVMELVKGLPLTEYCDARRLSVNERLDLFVQLCSAVQHAHQKAVIHRDLKPSNVLVTEHDGKPVPKVIDFGLAKALNASNMLTERTLHTAYGTVVGTPLYMAPEQVGINALDVDTRTDIYALGVILYELLTGSTPLERGRFKEAAWEEVKRLIREEEPPRPSTRLSSAATLPSLAASRQVDAAKLPGLIRGELDWIVMKALEKDRTRRYETATGLAKDVQRHLAGDAVEACPPTLGYRLRKFARKHRGPVITVAVVLLAVLLGTIGTTGGLVWAVGAERQAKADRDAALLAKEEAVEHANQARASESKVAAALEQQAADQYVWDMQAASAAFQGNNSVELGRLLDRHRPKPGQPDRRGIEWHHWDRRLHAELVSEKLPESPTNVFATSADGSHVAWVTVLDSATPDEQNPKPSDLKVMNLATRTVVLTHELPEMDGRSRLGITLVLSRDGRRVAVVLRELNTAAVAGSTTRKIRVVDVATNRVVHSTDGPRPAIRHGFERANWLDFKPAFSPDGRLFAQVVAVPVGDGQFRNEVRVWDLDAKKEVCAPLLGDGLAESPFSSDGGRLVTARLRRATDRATDRVSVWDLTTGTESAGWDLPESSYLHTLAYNPVRHQLAAVAGDRLAVAENEKADPQGTMRWVELQIPEPRTLLLWSAAAKAPIRELPLPHAGALLRVWSCFSPDGARLAVYKLPAGIFGQNSSNVLTFWDAERGEQLPSLESQHLPSQFGPAGMPSFSPDGKQFLQLDGTLVRAWDTSTGKLIQTLLGHDAVQCGMFSPDGTRIRAITFGGGFKEWGARPRNQIVMPVAGSGTFLSALTCNVSADGSRVFALGREKQDPKSNQTTEVVWVWDATGRPVRSLAVPPQDAATGTLRHHRLVVSRDGRRAVLCRQEFNRTDTTPLEIIAWDVDTGNVILKTIEKQEGRFPIGSAISPDGRFVAAWNTYTIGPTGRIVEPVGRTVRLIDLNAAGQERPPIALPWAARISGVDFLPDGRLGILAHPQGALNADIKLVVWDLERNSAQATVDLPTSSGINLSIWWSPDGKRFIYGDNFSAKGFGVYDVSAARPVGKKLEIAGGEGFGALVFAWSPDGKRIAGFVSFAGQRPMLKLWDAETSREVMRVPAPALVTGMAFRADGSGLLIADAEIAVGPKRRGGAGGMNLVLTSLDTTPRPEPKK